MKKRVRFKAGGKRVSFLAKKRKWVRCPSHYRRGERSTGQVIHCARRRGHPGIHQSRDSAGGWNWDTGQ